MKNEIIAVVNQKGGVGKTTTTYNLGVALAEQGKRVLLIDFDPQCSLTICMGYDDPDNIKNSIASLMLSVINDEPLPPKEEVIISVGNLDLIPCNIELTTIDVSLVNAMSRETILKGVLSQYRSDYDYIIIDCARSLGMLSINALTACTGVIIPVTLEYLSNKGIEILIKSIMQVKKRINPDIEILGILLTMYTERMRLTQTVENIIIESYGNYVNIYNVKIPRSVKVGESILMGKSVIEYARDNMAASAYINFAQEVLKNVTIRNR